AQNHLGFETRAELLFAAFGPQPHDTAREDEPKNEKRGGNEARDRVEGQELGSIGTSSEPMVKTAARRSVTRMPPITRRVCDLGFGGVTGRPPAMGEERA